jgi:hypothetical protein
MRRGATAPARASVPSCWRPTRLQAVAAAVRLRPVAWVALAGPLRLPLRRRRVLLRGRGPVPGLLVPRLPCVCASSCLSDAVSWVVDVYRGDSVAGGVRTDTSNSSDRARQCGVWCERRAVCATCCDATARVSDDSGWSGVVRCHRRAAEQRGVSRATAAAAGLVLAERNAPAAAALRD